METVDEMPNRIYMPPVRPEDGEDDAGGEDEDEGGNRDGAEQIYQRIDICRLFVRQKMLCWQGFAQPISRRACPVRHGGSSFALTLMLHPCAPAGARWRRRETRLS